MDNFVDEAFKRMFGSNPVDLEPILTCALSG
jgi:hypothetical protein